MKKQKQPTKKSNIKIFVIIGIILAGVGAGYGGINAMTPVNSKTPVFGFGENIFINAKHTDQGFLFVTQSGGGKKSMGTTQVSPTIYLTKDQLASVHIMNNDKDFKHNFNIDEFNVHSKDLGYFEPQTITFVADKTGTFRYHCTLHPEMSGQVIVQ